MGSEPQVRCLQRLSRELYCCHTNPGPLPCSKQAIESAHLPCCFSATTCPIRASCARKRHLRIEVFQPLSLSSNTNRSLVLL
ncbi:hypothetical protein HBH98_102100 [Parastagonospora nodorum]|nr:hypothetical protein HBH51_065940 [Parastagonospora nodorum]KAH3999322.1 hypothetical protein HBI10_122410 [Parastagonospora nodorum]KAH4024901.1 hypothetical protein HBI13_074800 [Parastagonospora nodorum]KAH4067534.1 hypothetical protein HBH50_128440 [Parastagonospora nodorum]KAH4086633.1 hypothetical protein HBH48_137860 [Parastagonospora nodorum]